MLTCRDMSIGVNGRSIINHVSYAISSGQLAVVMGPNGTGKSSLLYALAGHPHYVITNGSVLFNDVDLLTCDVYERATSGLMLVPQHQVVIPGVLVRTFLFEAYRSLVDATISFDLFLHTLHAVLVRVGLDVGFADRALFDGFSGGEKKRLELAQVLLLRPSFLLLDEIDSGLDLDGIVLVKDVIDQLRTDNPLLTVLCVTHSTVMARMLNPDYVGIIKDGVLVQWADKSLIDGVERGGYDQF